MTNLKYNIGDKLKIKDDCKDECGVCEEHTGWIEITGKAKKNYTYNAYDLDGIIHDDCSDCYKDAHIEGYYNPVKTKVAKWTQEPTKYHKENNWFTKEKVSINGRTMSIDDFKTKTTLYRSLLSAYNKYFPKN